jgi:hypothetical protein
MADEGKAARVAFDGPDLDHDKLIGQIEARNREDSERASSAGESRQKIGEFLDETSLNSKAFSWLRQILKVGEKADGQNKAMDIIRSLETALPMVKNHVGGQGTGEMDLDGPQDEAPAEEPEDDPQDVDPGDHVDDDNPEQAEFNDEVDAAMGGDGVVTPIDFGGAA